jgi:hypothetical protein
LRGSDPSGKAQAISNANDPFHLQFWSKTRSVPIRVIPAHPWLKNSFFVLVAFHFNSHHLQTVHPLRFLRLKPKNLSIFECLSPPATALSPMEGDEKPSSAETDGRNDDRLAEH